jgi:hypothetical protein
MCENMQFCQVFGWTDPLLNELFEAADEGHLEGEERKFALFGGEGSASAGAISYSPPMLGDSLHCGNPAEISLYVSNNHSPNKPYSIFHGSAPTTNVAQLSAPAFGLDAFEGIEQSLLLPVAQLLLFISIFVTTGWTECREM